MSLFLREERDGSQSEMNDEELERKVKQDLENFEYDENDSIALIDGGSIFFDEYIQKQAYIMARDERENEKEHQLVKEFFGKNVGGQEIFEEIDRDLANLKKMTKVRVKKDKPSNKKDKQKNVEKRSSFLISGDEANRSIAKIAQQDENKQFLKEKPSGNDDDGSYLQSESELRDRFGDESLNESFVEIEDMFGEKVKYIPDVITESQYREIKAKAKEQFEERKKEIVFAEDAIQRKFMEEEGLLSDEHSILSEEFEDELKDDLLQCPDKIEARVKEELNYRVNAERKKVNMNDQINGSKLLEKSQNIKVKGGSQMKISGVLRARGSEEKYKLVMSGQKQLRSSMNESSLMKQKMDQKLEASKEKMNLEREIVDMENEDLLSLEYEEDIQRKMFGQKDWRLPDSLPLYTEQKTPICKYESFRVLSIQFDEPLNLNLEGNVLTRDCLEICVEDARRVKNNRRNKRNSIIIQIVDKSLSKGKFTSLESVTPKIDRLIISQMEKQNRLEESSVGYESISEIFYSKMRRVHGQILENYDLNGIYSSLEKIFREHKPKLIRQFFDSEKENILEDQEQSQEDLKQNQELQGQCKSLRQFLSFDVFQNFEKKRRLELKLEKLIDMEEIDKLPNLEIVSLSMNRIERVDKLLQLKNSKIVELNLAQNLLVDYSGVNALRELRSLNLELNRITHMADLSACKELEVLNLNNNQISKIQHLQENKQLRKLYLFRNKIQQIDDALKENIFLEELDLSRNKLLSLKGLENNILLKKLVVSYNLLRNIPSEFSYLFMLELYLNGNELSDISGLCYLPCLQLLNLANNRIERITTIPLLPSMHSLIVNFNSLAHFESVFNLVRTSPNLKYLTFNDNLFTKRGAISEDLRDLYDYLFLRHLPNLLELNHVQDNLGRTKYLQVRFNSILKNKAQHKSSQIQAFLIPFAIITNQYAFLQLQKKSRATNLFAQTLSFYILDSAFTFNHLQAMRPRIVSNPLQNNSLIRPSSSNIRKTSILTDSKCSVSSSMQSKHKIIIQNNNNLSSSTILKRTSSLTSYESLIISLKNSIFFAKDFFDHKYRKSIRKIQDLTLRCLFRLRQKKKRYLKNEHKITLIQSVYRGYTLRKILNLRKRFDERLAHKQAILIQKTFRGYRLRKKKKYLFRNVKYVDDDEELQEIDDEWFKQNQTEFDNALKIPDTFDVTSFLTHNQYPQQIAQETSTHQISTTPINVHPQSHKNTLLPPIRQPNTQAPLQQNNNFMSSSHQKLSAVQQRPLSPILLKKVGQPISNNSDTDSLQSSRMSFRSEDQLANPLSSSSTSSQIFKSKKTSSKTLAPVKSLRVTEEEKEKIKNEWGFTKPEVVQTFAYRLERSRKNKVKTQPLTAEQRYDKFLQNSKSKK